MQYNFIRKILKYFIASFYLKARTRTAILDTRPNQRSWDLSIRRKSGLTFRLYEFQLCGVWKLPFCHHRAISLMQNRICFHNPCINLNLVVINLLVSQSMHHSKALERKQTLRPTLQNKTDVRACLSRNKIWLLPLRYCYSRLLWRDLQFCSSFLTGKPTWRTASRSTQDQNELSTKDRWCRHWATLQQRKLPTVQIKNLSHISRKTVSLIQTNCLTTHIFCLSLLCAVQ